MAASRVASTSKADVTSSDGHFPTIESQASSAAEMARSAPNDLAAGREQRKGLSQRRA